MTKVKPADLVFACGLREEILAKIGETDVELRRLLSKTLPRDFPPDVRRKERDRRILATAAVLRANLVGRDNNQIAMLLAEAGKRLESNRKLEGPVFDALKPPELASLTRLVTAAFLISPARADGSRWPTRRQLQNILRRHGGK